MKIIASSKITITVPSGQTIDISKDGKRPLPDEWCVMHCDGRNWKIISTINTKTK